MGSSCGRGRACGACGGVGWDGLVSGVTEGGGKVGEGAAGGSGGSCYAAEVAELRGQSAVADKSRVGGCT